MYMKAQARCHRKNLMRCPHQTQPLALQILRPAFVTFYTFALASLLNYQIIISIKLLEKNNGL